MSSVDVILAIDPGTRCGWALRLHTGTIMSGVWDLKQSRHEGAGMRWIYLRKFLRHTLDGQNCDMIAYEEVRRHLGTDAAHIYGGIVAILQEHCEQAKIPYTAIPVATIKKHATGKGNADKGAMVLAAQLRWPGWVPEDDNEADARWILDKAVADFTTSME